MESGILLAFHNQIYARGEKKSKPDVWSFKGQIISEWIFGALNFLQKQKIVKIYALDSKKRFQ